MSSKSVAAEIRQNILPKCYEDLLAKIDDPGGLPKYKELLQMLDLKWVCPSTAWRWLQLMGYKYDEKSVAVCLSKVNIEMCRRFSGKAQGYMLGYHHQALEVKDGREEVKSFERNELTFSGEFISQVMRECINVDG
jgi:hypothetical protein